ncbi:MAG: hypothetical protein GX565_11260 [Lentisphaerae bacterium]|nr:hypothetical protein [Lentisphaerota bacterium]
MLNLSQIFRCCGARRRGSALLIVLGFLSFMIISGVSFAIYMRIERQASSNYRHAVNGRHLLNAGLARAMEEIDSELRLSDNDERKFPDWPGRVRVSAANEDEDNDSDARVLSIEALSFLPPFLVNDVRRYAVRQKNDQPYEGAKWRTLKGPEGEVNGRYAYVCVNVSDMLDVNTCRAQYRDATTNRVSLGHLFEDDPERKKFDDNYAQKDLHYFSLQDFYSARYERDKSDLSSPFHRYIFGGNFTPFNNEDLLKQVFITDSIAKPEPVKKDACNIWLNPPLAPGLLLNSTPDSTELKFAPDGEFLDAFKKVFNSSPDEQVMAALLKDYIDVDNVPSLLNAPCLEMVPMISQVTIPHDILKYSVSSEVKAGANGNPDVTVYTLHLLDDSTLEFPIEVEVVWPFKNTQHRNLSPAYNLEVEAFLVVDKNGNERPTTGFQNEGEWIRLEMTDSGSIPPLWNNTITSENDCFKKIDVTMKADKDDVTKKVIQGTDFQDGFTPKFRVSLCTFVRIKEGTVWVDSVPHHTPENPMPDDSIEETPKLYFQTTEIPLAPGTVVPTAYTWDWTNLEVADPRFNHNASNWVKNDAEQRGAAPGVNKSTKDILDLREGRDRDLFMFVANTGVLQSPGELGFIIRPHQFKNSDDPSRKFNSPNAAEPREKEDMFRTIRLYDHGANQERDDVYKYFYAARPDGTLPGARVNPLSDMPEVLEAALWDTPLDYWIASTNNGLSAAQRKNLTFTRHARYFSTTTSTDSNWKSFRDAWADGLDKVMNESKNPDPVWSKTLSDYYGDAQWLAWYSEDVARKNIFGIDVPNALHEIDRKMLYSFSLDSFSDRQQLFLYFIRAEVTMPAFGGGSGMQSLAGGRAVALVWRDPYPRGFVKDDKESTWKQYPVNSNTEKGYEGYHDTRVLFFKQLGQ